MKLALLLLPLLCLAGLPGAAWGEKGHRLIASNALRSLPPGVSSWYSGQEYQVVSHASDPDHWKHDRKEPPRHFINSEVYGGPSGVPTSTDEAVARIGSRRFAKAGQLPWVIQDQVRNLAQAFRSRNRGQVLMETAYLSHYVGDLHVPLHSTANFDGQWNGQKGVHHRWETGLVERYVEESSLRVLPATRGATLQSPWRWLQESYALVPLVLQDDQASGQASAKGRRRGGAYWPLFWHAQGSVVRGQLERAGQRTGELVVLAWEMGGRPK